jgi:6-phosphogluconolactonase
MKTLYTLLLFIVLFGCKTAQDNAQEIENKKRMHFYVGTYTKKASKGIYKYELSKDGIFQRIGLVAETANPSFLTKTNDNKTLLAVDETSKDRTGFVKSYKILKDSLVFISTSKSGGAHPCHIMVNDENQILVANYTGGNVGLLKVNKTGELSSLLDVQQHVGKGTTERQTKPHAHSAWFHPTKAVVISVDLGTNQLWFFTIDKNKLIFTNQKTLKMADGAGPRHLTFHPNNKWMYVLNELNNTISLVKEEKETYFVASSISTLPKDFSAYSKAADIHISKDGKFLYASNRGHDSIVIYEVNENGTLKTIGHQAVLGKNPRNFSLSPKGDYLLVANQDSNNIISFKRNATTGKLTFVDEIAAPMPVCILF